MSPSFTKIKIKIKKDERYAFCFVCFSRVKSNFYMGGTNIFEFFSCRIDSI